MTTINIKSLRDHGWTCCAILAAFVMLFTATSCKDDEEGMGIPEITGVRMCDPAKADSLFTKASTGQTFAVIGRNLADVQRVYINDQKVSFNPTLNTDHSIIISVPTEENGFVLTAFDSSLKDEIRIETSHGTATYSFKITAPYPSISRVQAMYPRKPGDLLNVYGLNLVDIERVYFTDIPAEVLDTTVWETIGGNIVEVKEVTTVMTDHRLNSRTQTYETNSQLGVTMPDLPYQNGSLVVQCASGTTYIDFSVVPGRPVLLDISSDMPVPGEKVVITGREFVQVESVDFGDIHLGAGQFEVSSSEDAITFTMPRMPSGNDGTLTVVTPGGTASTLFCNYNCLLTNFEGEDAINNGWDPDVVYETVMPGTAPYTCDGIYARLTVESEAQQWWGKMIYYRKDWDGHSFTLPSFDIIPETATADEVYLAMEVFDNNCDYNNGVFSGYLRYMIQPIGDQENTYDNFEWVDYGAGTFRNFHPVLADINDESHKGMWYRHVVPLSVFPCYTGLTYAEIVNVGLNQFRIQSINQGTARGFIDVCFDNVRIFYKKK